MPLAISIVSVTDMVVVHLECPRPPGYQCQRCLQVLPREKFQKHPKKWCVYCVADETAELRDKALTQKAESLAQRLISENNLGRHAMSTVEEFFGEFDASMGGARMYAVKMNQVIDGLLDKGALSSAGQLLLQLQKLRFLVQKQHSDEDFTQLDLEQKKARLQLEILQFIKEKSGDDAAQALRLEAFELHGAVGAPMQEAESTLKL